MPMAGPTFPPPSHVTNAIRAISSLSQDGGHHLPDAGFRIAPGSGHVTAQELPDVDVTDGNQAIDENILFSRGSPLQPGCKLALHRLPMGLAAAFQPALHLRQLPLLGQVADDEVAHLLVMVEEGGDRTGDVAPRRRPTLFK